MVVLNLQRILRMAALFRARLFRGEGGKQWPAQFAVGEHWSTRKDIAETYGPNIREEVITLSNPYTNKRVRVFQRTYPKNRFSKDPRTATKRRRFPRPTQQTWIVLEIL